MEIELKAGDRVGDYTVEGILGRGGMARVYRAVGPDGEAVALKLILADLAGEETFRRRFELETSIARRVSHPNVVRVLDSGVHNDIPWLTQTLVHGGTLAERLEQGGALSVQDAVGIGEAVASGLDAVHDAGLIHRDVKPANILLREDGTACITDFGLARDTYNDSRLTRPGQTLGSMDYMAPEQIRGGDIGPSTDVYGLGCVVFECFVGVPPFGDRYGMSVLLAQLEDPPPHPSDRRPELARELGDAILLALAKAPEDRPESAVRYAELVRAAASPEG
ncbi:MAG: eukaryotic-like serine/threonine-protein kinase [Solirubrobacteraceae bacterium]|nr:eukaryotic-like serine/threonine-protein kinase [Solirubrobacteraceae bacterium]